MDYINNMTDFAPTARKERKLLNVGIWGTVNSTHVWPEVINLWEFIDGWPGVARNFRHEYGHPTLQDDSLRPWWNETAAFRDGGYSRLLVPSPSNRSIEQLIADGVKGEVFYHQRITTAKGGAREVEAVTTGEFKDQASEYSMELLGVYRTALVDDTEAIAIWAFQEWEDWARFEADWDQSVLAKWRNRLSDLAVEWKHKLIAPTVRSPLQTGKIL